jgi:cytidyltransferase-like protein
MVTGTFDDLRARQIRLLQEASRLGPVTVLLWPDEVVRVAAKKEPRFPITERLYFLRALRFVTRAMALSGHMDITTPPVLPDFRPDYWIDETSASLAPRKAAAKAHGMEYRLLPAKCMRGFPALPALPGTPGRKKVIVTGSFDWFHSGHVRFFEQVSAYGDLYVVVGHDANIRLLKGPGHPLLTQEERCYVAGSIRHVTQALISTGNGWLDADPEIQRIKPDIYAVNEDGDKGGKREYCQERGIEYLVLKRTPAPGLPKRSSTSLRGF